MQLEQFARQRIAVTGASGFIGSALVRRLRTVACSLDLVSRCRVEPLKVTSAATVHYSVRDLTTVETWRDLLSQNDVIFHLSAQTDLYRAEQCPAENEAANVLPLERLAVAVSAVEGRAPRVILASTATIVGLNERNPVDDAHPDYPITVYDRHKKRCEEILAEAAAAGRLQPCSLRLSNVFGFGAPSTNSNRGFLNAMIERATRGETLTLYGTFGEYVRDFIHIDDVVDAFCCAAAASAGLSGEHYLIASGVGHSLREALDAVRDETQAVFGRAPRMVEIPPPVNLHPIERRNFIGDSTRFSALTGWRSKVDLREGIRRFMREIAGSPSAENHCAAPALGAQH